MLLAFQVILTEGGHQPSGFFLGNVLTWTSEDLSPDTDITVQVRALNTDLVGALSNILTVKTRFGGML